MTVSTNVIDNSALLVSPTSEPYGTEQPTVKPTRGRPRSPTPTDLTKLTKQLRYYYNHRTKVLTNKITRYQQTNKVKTINNISLIHDMRNNSHSVLKGLNRNDITNKNLNWFKEAFLHGHGKPNNSRYTIRISKVNTASRFWFHVIPQLAIVDDGSEPSHVMFNEKCEFPKNKNIITARKLSIQTANFLGLKWGTSIYWKEYHSHNSFAWGKVQTNRVEMHSICFDGSGLDISHPNDLAKLVECRIETNAKGMDLLILFAEKHIINHYLQCFRGNKLLLTSETENAYRDYIKNFPIAETV